MKKSILQQALRLAVKKARKENVKVDRLFMCELFGEMYQNSKSEKKSKQIIEFAESCGLTVIIP